LGMDKTSNQAQSLTTFHHFFIRSLQESAIMKLWGEEQCLTSR
jgi:hypothetical protein